MSEPQKKQIQVEIDDATAQGIYTNLASIAHSEQEFVIDFMFLSPNQPKAKVRSRIITSPKHAKRLMAAIIDNVKKFEAKFGEIKPDLNLPPMPPQGGIVN